MQISGLVNSAVKLKGKLRKQTEVLTWRKDQVGWENFLIPGLYMFKK